MKLLRGFFELHCLVILALVASWVSPACAFMNGQSKQFLEICTANGVERIAVADAYIPPVEKSREQDENQAPMQSSVKDLCPYCLSALSAFQHADISAVIFAPLFTSESAAFSTPDFRALEFQNNYSARAPPA